MTCPKCNLPSTITTNDFFSNICSNCGTLLSENCFLSENIYQPSSQIPNTISLSSKLSRRLENFTQNSTLDKTINSLISKLSLPSHFFPKVKRYYNCCINKNFASFGRKAGKSCCRSFAEIADAGTFHNKKSFLNM